MASSDSRVTMPKNIFHGISSFVAEVQRCFALKDDWYTLGDRELRCGIALAYCIEKGLDSIEEFEKSLAKFKEIQSAMPMIIFTRKASTWDSRPIHSLNFYAASVLLKGSEIFGREECIKELTDLKEHYGKPVSAPPVKIEYEKLLNGTDLWARYELNRLDGLRKEIGNPFPKSRTRGILRGLLKVYVEGGREDEVGGNDAALADEESEPEVSLSDPATSQPPTTWDGSHASAPADSLLPLSTLTDRVHG